MNTSNERGQDMAEERNRVFFGLFSRRPSLRVAVLRFTVGVCALSVGAAGFFGCSSKMSGATSSAINTACTEFGVAGGLLGIGLGLLCGMIVLAAVHRAVDRHGSLSAALADGKGIITWAEVLPGLIVTVIVAGTIRLHEWNLNSTLLIAGLPYIVYGTVEHWHKQQTGASRTPEVQAVPKTHVEPAIYVPGLFSRWPSLRIAVLRFTVGVCVLSLTAAELLLCTSSPTGEFFSLSGFCVSNAVYWVAFGSLLGVFSSVLILVIVHRLVQQYGDLSTALEGVMHFRHPSTPRPPSPTPGEGKGERKSSICIPSPPLLPKGGRGGLRG